jgi:hypothetical protein
MRLQRKGTLLCKESGLDKIFFLQDWSPLKKETGSLHKLTLQIWKDWKSGNGDPKEPDWEKDGKERDYPGGEVSPLEKRVYLAMRTVWKKDVTFEHVNHFVNQRADHIEILLFLARAITARREEAYRSYEFRRSRRTLENMLWRHCYATLLQNPNLKHLPIKRTRPMLRRFLKLGWKEK